MARWLIALIGMVLQVSVASSLAACENPQEQIVWLKEGGAAHKEAIFIPEKLLQAGDWSKLPLTERDRTFLAAGLKRPEDLEKQRRRFQREENLCWNQGAPSGEEGGTYPSAKALRDWLKEFDLSVIGRVEDVVPGWDSQRGKVAQMVYVRVLDVLQDKNEKTKNGAVLLYTLQYGSIHLKGTPICREPWKGFKVPHMGDEILLLGRPFWSDSRYIEFAFTFPVEDGKVLYQPYGAVKQFSPIEPKDLI